MNSELYTEPQWNALLPQFADASIYQTWAYGAVHWNEKQLSHFTLKSANGDVLAAAQVRIVQIPLIKKGVAYVRWGPLWRRRDRPENPEIFRQAIAGLKEEYVRKRGLLLRIIPNLFQTDPCAASIQSILADLELKPDPKTSPYRTIRLDLTRSLEDLRKGLHQRWRNKLKNAEKSGFTIRTSTTEVDYARFQIGYGEMMDRKRFDTTVDPAEFGRIHSSLPESLKLRILLCEKDNSLLNALVLAGAGDSAIYLLASTSNAGLQSNGAFLLQWEAIQLLKKAGFQYYDLGGINPQRNPGVYQFKSGMGGKEAVQTGSHACTADLLTSLCVSAGETLQGLIRGGRKQPVRERDPVSALASTT